MQNQKLYISHIYAKNWRNFPEIALDLHPQKNLLIGANASGKTNFLDLFRFMHDVVRDGLQKAVLNRGGIPKLRFLKYNNQKSESFVLLYFTLKNYHTNDYWEYRLQFRLRKGGERNLYVDEEIIKFNGQEVSNISTEKNIPENKEERIQTLIEGQYTSQEFLSVREFFENIFYFHLNPLSVRNRTQEQQKMPYLDPNGSNFIEIIYKSKKSVRENFIKTANLFLKKFIPNLEELTFGQDKKTGVYHLFLKMTDGRQNEIKQDELLMSDGTLRLLGLLWSIFEKSNKNSVLLIEEPEISLHSGIINFLPKALHQIQRTKDVQIFVTTHSKEMLFEPIKPENVFGIYMKDKGSNIKNIRNWKDFEILEKSGFTLSEASEVIIKDTFNNQLPLF